MYHSVQQGPLTDFLYILSCVEERAPKIHVHPEPQTKALFGHRAHAGVISLMRPGWIRAGP